jgi:hypothetical protein
MRPMLDAPDIAHAVVLEEPKGDSVVTAARYTPSFELEPQRLRQPVRIGRQGGGNEFGDRSGDFVRKSLEGSDRRRGQLHRPGRIAASHRSP